MPKKPITSNPPLPVEKHYRVEEAADLLSVHHATIRRLVYKGELRGVRLGTRLVIPASALSEYLAKHSTTAA